MQINKLQVVNLRNLKHVDIEPHAVLNMVHGDNGAGKTSVLESVVVLSRGRSFRTPQASDLLGPINETFSVFAEIQHDSSRTGKLGIERSGKHWRARKDGGDLNQLSRLTRELPVMLLEPNSHQIVSGRPDIRRKYLDWGLFHVEREYLDVWGRFSKVLKQRNAAVRGRQLDVLGSIDQVFCVLGDKIDSLRASFTHDIKHELNSLLPKLSSEMEPVDVSYHRGWKSDSLADCLKKDLERDLHNGSTSSGPHRADLVLSYRGAAARSRLSRGEQKVLSAALLLAQATVVAENGDKPVVLLDDLASEFDPNHLHRVLDQAVKIGGQVWITGTQPLGIERPHKVFHVKHGSVSEVV